jgi:hypothetical protein
MKKFLLLSLVLTLAFAGVAVASNVYNFGNTDTNQLLKYIFDTDNGHDHDGVNSKQVTTTGPVAGLTSGTIAGVTINSSIIGGSAPAAATVTALTASGATALNGTVTLGDAVTDINTVTGKIAGATPLTFDGATANTVYTILAVDDPASTSKTVTLPARTGTVSLQTAPVALTPSGAVALTIGVGNQIYTDTVTDNEDQTITFSGAGTAGDTISIIFTTAGSADEVVTFHATLVSSVGTLTLGTDAGKFYVVRFISNGSHWYETSRTAVQT